MYLTTMEATSFSYSTKNIPIPSEQEYLRTIIRKTEEYCRRMRWKAFFYLKPKANTTTKETYGFNTKKAPPQVAELIPFENKLLHIIKNIKFYRNTSQFQNQLNLDIHNDIKGHNKILVAADKSNNYYKLDVEEYNALLVNNITSSYKKVSDTTVQDITTEAKWVAKNIQLDDRINTMAERQAFLTLKDHKDNFANRPTCRLLNPAKSELGKISKKITERINKDLQTKIDITQWRNTTAVLGWFNNIQNKDNHTFIEFDVIDFYPSISAELLNRALEFAATHVNIEDHEHEILLHTKKSILFHGGSSWGKKSSDSLHDVTMGSHDGAETCELVGAFMLEQIGREFGNTFGLYRDDGLGVTTANPRTAEKMKKQLCKIFKDNGLNITINANRKTVNFLDVTLNLTTGEHKIYTKPTNKPLYINQKSNHPPSIIKNLPAAINKRLSEISSNSQSFSKEISPYQLALTNSGYNHQLKYSANPTCTQHPRKNRNRNILWFNPPFSSNVSTNIGKIFLQLIDTEFPPNNTLHKIFNRNSVKVSYSCMPNIQQLISGHNKRLLTGNNNNAEIDRIERTCNCRIAGDCPLSGECLAKSIIYQATVSTTDGNPAQSYIGLTETTFKARYANHKASFRHSGKRHSTELSKHIWHLKDNSIDFTLSWKIIKRAAAYSPSNNKCSLCNWEKYFIIFTPHQATLNKRNELASICRHASKYLLCNHKT